MKSSSDPLWVALQSQSEKFSGFDKVVSWSVSDTTLLMAIASIESLIGHAGNQIRKNKVLLIVQHSDLDENKLATVKGTLSGILPRLWRVYFFNLGSLFPKSKVQTFYPVQAYFRLALPVLFPRSETVIYLDADTYILEDIGNLFSLELGDKPVAAINDRTMVRYVDSKRPLPRKVHKLTADKYLAQQLGINKDEYINSGVLIFNPSCIDLRAYFDFVMHEYHRNIFWFADQCILSKYLKGNFLHLGEEWNSQHGDYWFIKQRSMIRKVLHFSGWFRPWVVIRDPVLSQYWLTLVDIASRYGIKNYPSHWFLRVLRSLVISAYRIAPTSLRNLIVSLLPGSR